MPALAQECHWGLDLLMDWDWAWAREGDEVRQMPPPWAPTHWTICGHTQLGGHPEALHCGTVKLLGVVLLSG